VLAPHFKEGEVVSSATLVAKGLLRRRSGKLPSVKILGGLSRDAALPAKLIFQNVTVSMSARGAIEKASGTIEIPKPVN
jgi:ribosomal protein L15